MCISDGRSLRSICSGSDCSGKPAPDRSRLDELDELDELGILGVSMASEVSDGSMPFRRGYQFIGCSSVVYRLFIGCLSVVYIFTVRYRTIICI